MDSSLTPYIMVVSNDDEYRDAVSRYFNLHLPWFTVFKVPDPFTAINTMHSLDRSTIFVVEHDLRDVDGFRLINDHIRKTFRFDSFPFLVFDADKWEEISKCSNADILCRRKSLYRKDPSEGVIFNLDSFFLGEIQFAVQEMKKLELDPLTRFYTRKAGEARLSRDYKRARNDNEGSGVELSIIFADVNDLKMTNDTYGHRVGDALLKAFSDVVHDCIRERREFDYCIRWGADEFVIVLYKAKPQVARLVVSRILDRLEVARVEIAPGRYMRPYVAMGVETLSRRQIKSLPEKEGLSYLIDGGDKDMYAQKHAMKEAKRREVQKFMQKVWCPPQFRLSYDSG